MGHSNFMLVNHYSFCVIIISPLYLLLEFFYCYFHVHLLLSAVWEPCLFDCHLLSLHYPLFNSVLSAIHTQIPFS